MARSSREEAEKTKCTLLATALELFYDKGVPKVTLTEIAKKAGYTRGAIYSHFSSKEDIIKEMLKVKSRLLSEQVNSMISPEVPPLYSLFLISREMIRMVEKSREFALLIRVMFYSLHLLEEPEIKETVRKIFEEDLQRDITLLEQARDKGEIRDDLDVETIAQSLSSMVQGLMMDWVFDRETFSMKRASASLEIFFRGIRKNCTSVAV
jgi:TetR/AcrR family acrAB operon transcriptional repressor